MLNAMSKLINIGGEKDAIERIEGADLEQEEEGEEKGGGDVGEGGTRGEYIGYEKGYRPLTRNRQLRSKGGGGGDRHDCIIFSLEQRRKVGMRGWGGGKVSGENNSS
jgi:hypothetical protein